MSAFIENQDASLAVALLLETREIAVEAATQILKCQLHHIRTRVGGLVNCTCEYLGTIIGSLDDIENCLDYSLGFFTAHRIPWGNSA